ncbi:MAG: hypothetical protein ACYS0I_16000 [Planctomycetota bacterium]|jgi:DNA-directed RNA polymerase subunit RPC12/RpoP
MKSLRVVPIEKTALEGPYECPKCGGHLMIDVSYLDDVSGIITCPYCTAQVTAPESLDGFIAKPVPVIILAQL